MTLAIEKRKQGECVLFVLFDCITEKVLCMSYSFKEVNEMFTRLSGV